MEARRAPARVRVCMFVRVRVHASGAVGRRRRPASPRCYTREYILVPRL